MLLIAFYYQIVPLVGLALDVLLVLVQLGLLFMVYLHQVVQDLVEFGKVKLLLCEPVVALQQLVLELRTDQGFVTVH